MLELDPILKWYQVCQSIRAKHHAQVVSTVVQLISALALNQYYTHVLMLSNIRKVHQFWHKSATFKMMLNNNVIKSMFTQTWRGQTGGFYNKMNAGSFSKISQQIHFHNRQSAHWVKPLFKIEKTFSPLIRKMINSLIKRVECLLFLHHRIYIESHLFDTLCS